MYLLVICTAAFEKCLLSSFIYLLIGLLVLLSVRLILYMLDMSSTWITYLVKVFSHPLAARTLLFLFDLQMPLSHLIFICVLKRDITK
jgi:hypothetical protein